MMKPNTKIAMENLVTEARQKLPFYLTFDKYCEGRCDECPEKLLEILDMDLSDWEAKLQSGFHPNLGDVHALARDCKQVYAILQKKGIVKEVLE